MLNSLNKARQTAWFYNLILMIVVTILLPFMADHSDWSDTTEVVGLYFVLNGLFALYFGYQIRVKGLRFYWIFAQGLLFALVTTGIGGWVNEEYGYYLAVFYLVLTIFTFWTDTRSDPDENMQPIDGGLKNL